LQQDITGNPMTLALDLFLASVEKRAFRMARFATRQDADALEVVQEAMMKLVQQYASRPETEWKPLFYRILENCLIDWHRQQQRQRRWFVFWNSATTDNTRDEDPLDNIAAETDNTRWSEPAHNNGPEHTLARERQQQAVLALLEDLPLQQQQCFLLRCWEGLSVQETADAMGISSGSVKTHLHRVRQKLDHLCQNHQLDQEASHETG
jgi:RNA polymerase sigma-70 factor, ECF subfamily